MKLNWVQNFQAPKRMCENQWGLMLFDVCQIIWCILFLRVHECFDLFVDVLNKGLHFDLFIYKVIILLQKTQNILAEVYELISGFHKTDKNILQNIYIFFMLRIK